MDFGYTVTATPDPKTGDIALDLQSQFGAFRDTVWREVMHTQERATREALIALGWAPPPPDNWRERLRIEKTDLDVKIERLERFRISPTWVMLTTVQKDLILTQLVHMARYRLTLKRRLAAEGIE